MPYPFPRATHDFVTWMRTHSENSEAHAARLGLDAADIAENWQHHDEVKAKIQAAYEARRAAIAATTAANEAIEAARAHFASRCRIVHAQPEVDDPLLVALGLKPRDRTRTKHAPIRPTGLIVTAVPGGAARLRWEGNDNARNTLYLVEKRVGGEGPWEFCVVVTRTTYRDRGNTPGTRVDYRVSAMRGDERTTPCDTRGAFMT
jgi:hypothetical protein